MKKIVLTGPESSGKTTLAEQLAAHFGTVWIPEFSRQYLEKLGRPYTPTDLVEIARGQMASEDEIVGKASNSLIFMDTSLEVVKVWSEVRFGFCDEKIEEWLAQRPPDYYLLCLPDLPWSPDPQRENPDDRDMLLERYRKELREQNLGFSQVWGIGSARLTNAITAVNDFLKP